MPTWVVIQNNRHEWVNVSVAGLKPSFVSYGHILEANIFDAGSKASLLFEKMALELTFVWHGQVLIPGIPNGSRLGAHICQSRHRAVS